MTGTLLGLVIGGTQVAMPQESHPKNEKIHQAVAELKKLRWGLFVCWSFSTLSNIEWTPGIKDAAFFDPKGCDVEQWVETAKAAEMGYVLFLAKHHDGFCLWDTQSTERKVTRSPLGRDVLADVRKACDKHGMKLAIYYSESDWTWPGAEDGKWRKGGTNPEAKKAEIKELLTRYGPVAFLWFDHAAGTGGLSHRETVEWCHRWQPDCPVGFNSGDPAGEIRLGEQGRPALLPQPAGSYLLAEFNYPIVPNDKRGTHWFYSETARNTPPRSAEALYRDYCEAVKCGNIFSLDVGPDRDGKLRDADIQTLRRVGQMIREKAPLPHVGGSTAATQKDQGTAPAADAAALRLVPFPKEVKLEPGLFSLRAPLVLEASADQLPVVAGLLRDDLKRARLPVPETRPLRAKRHTVILMPRREGEANPPSLTPALQKLPADKSSDEAYKLQITPSAVIVEGSGTSGLLHGVQTLVQLVRANRQDDGIPCLTIRDWPSLRWRCFQNDMTRGPSAKLETLQQQVALGALFKMNLFTYYMEYQYAFARHPDIGPPDGSFTPEELRRLVAYAKPLGMEILGSQQSFGHLGKILEKKPYDRLRENKEVLSPVNEDSYRLLDDLYADVCPLVPFPLFNVNCDETWGLGTGPSKELAKKLGVGGVYTQHMRRVHDLLASKYQKRMMMWADIALKNPDHLTEIPKDTILLSWGYEGFSNFEFRIVPLVKAGYDFFVCPGISDWQRLLPDFDRAEANIGNYIRDGLKHGAMGMINTEWKDGGETLNAPNWHGYAWGAECAWSGSTTRSADFNRRLGAILFGEKGEHFGQAIASLRKIPRLPWLPDAYGTGVLWSKCFWEDDFPLKQDPETRRTQVEQLLALVRPGIEHLQACRQEATIHREQLDALLFGAQRVELLAHRWLDMLEVARLYRTASEGPLEKAGPLLEKAEAIVCRHRERCEDFGKRFAALYLAENKPYALDWTMKRYETITARYASLGQRLADIREKARAGQPVPAPKSLGLTTTKAGTKPGS